MISQFNPPVWKLFHERYCKYDLKCNVIIDEYELQFPLVSLLNKKNIDQGNLAQFFLPTNAIFMLFFNI